MRVDVARESFDFVIKFKAHEEAEEVCELLKELLNVKKTHRCGTLFPGTPHKKQIDEHVTS